MKSKCPQPLGSRHAVICFQLSSTDVRISHLKILIINCLQFSTVLQKVSQSQWPSGLKWGSAAARLLGLRFEFHRGYGYLSLVCVKCCQVEVSVTGRSLVQRTPIDCGVSLCVIEKRQEWGDPGQHVDVAPEKNQKMNTGFINSVVVIDYLTKETAKKRTEFILP